MENQKPVAIALVIAVLFFVPYTRAFIVWLLPLGTGIDDLIVMAALAFAGVYWSWPRIVDGVRWLESRPAMLFAVIIFIAVAIVLAIVATYGG